MHADKVAKKTFSNPTELCEFLNESGPFRYAIEYTYIKGDSYMQKDEWYFSNSLEAIVRAYYKWDKNNLSLKYVQSTTEDIEGFGYDISGYWELSGNGTVVSDDDILWDFCNANALDSSFSVREVETEFYNIFMNYGGYFDWVSCYTPDSLHLYFHETSEFKKYLHDWREDLGETVVDYLQI